MHHATANKAVNKLIYVKSGCYGSFIVCFFFQAAKEAKARIPPWEMFKHETDKYSKFDEQVSLLKTRVMCSFCCFYEAVDSTTLQLLNYHQG